MYNKICVNCNKPGVIELYGQWFCSSLCAKLYEEMLEEFLLNSVCEKTKKE